MGRSLLTGCFITRYSALSCLKFQRLQLLVLLLCLRFCGGLPLLFCSFPCHRLRPSCFRPPGFASLEATCKSIDGQMLKTKHDGSALVPNPLDASHRTTHKHQHAWGAAGGCFWRTMTNSNSNSSSRSNYPSCVSSYRSSSNSNVCFFSCASSYRLRRPPHVHSLISKLGLRQLAPGMFAICSWALDQQAKLRLHTCTR
jgi:hypothetical protein